jgi:hypothetical protein
MKHRSIQSTAMPPNQLPFNDWALYVAGKLKPSNRIKKGGLWHKEKQQEVLNQAKQILK